MKDCNFYNDETKNSYPKNAINIPAATAEPITPETFDDMQ